MEDRWARDFLVEHARQSRNDIAFVDYSVKDPFDSAWKTNCKALTVLVEIPASTADDGVPNWWSAARDGWRDTVDRLAALLAGRQGVAAGTS